MLTIQAIHEYPKVELHCHLDGSIRPETLQKIAACQQLPIEEDLTKLKQKMTAPVDCKNLDDYLSCFDYVLPYLQTRTALEMAAFDVMEQAANDGICYLEIRFAPSLSQQKGLSLTEAILAVTTGIKQAEKKYTIVGNLLIIGMRQTSTTALHSVFTEATALQSSKIVGFDLAGPEEDLYLETLELSLKEIAEKNNLQITLHAGECGCVHNIFQALHYGATRIGHGIALNHEPDLQAKFAQTGACIEGCPTSNVQTKAIASYADYPFREWLEQKVPFCINTDNRTVSDTTLTKEYTHLLQQFGMSTGEFYLLNQQALTFSFAPPTTKERLKAQMIAAQKKPPR